MKERIATADEKAYQAIRKQILARRYPPGSQLVELDLAALMGLSRTPIRTALKRLAYEGLVLYRPNRGHTVAQPTVREVREAFWMRRKAEGLAAAEASHWITPDDRAYLESLVAEEDAACLSRDMTRVIDVSLRFHGHIAALSRNRYLHKLVAELNQQSTIYVAFYDFFASDPPRSPGEHRAVIAALCSGDPAEAQRAMEAHILSTEQGLSLPEDAESE